MTTEAFIGHTGAIRAIAVCADGRRVISGGADHSVRVWDLTTGVEQHVLSGHAEPVQSIVVSSTQRLITCDGKTVYAWDLADGTGGDTGVRLRRNASFTAVATEVEQVVAAWSGQVDVWDLHGNHLDQYDVRGTRISSVAVTPDGSVVTWGAGPSGVQVWDRNSKSLRRFGIGAVHVVTISADGKRILAGNGDGKVWLLDRAGTVLREFNAHSGSITALTFGADGQAIVSGCSDGNIVVHDLANTHSTVLSGHEDRVYAIAATPDGRRLVSAGKDGTIWVWNRQTGAPVAHTGSTMRTPPPRIGLTSDQETDQDLLGFHNDVETLAAMIADRATEPPLCVALLGPWGSGKSSFMRQVQVRVDELADMSRREPERSVFAANVRQIRFNAWHYNDDHLWVGLVDHLFRNLAAPEARPDAEDVRAERESLRTRLAGIKAVQTAVEGARGTRLLRLLVSGVDPAESRRRRWALTGYALLAALALVLTVVGWTVWHGAILGSAAALVAVAAVVMPAAKIIGSVRRPVGPLLAAVRKRKDNLDLEARQTTERLHRLDAAERLAALIEEAKSGRYEQYRGLLGKVHQDLERLSTDMHEAETQWKETGSKYPSPLERIVLYVDDLDRCSPAKVVDVLAAVHLLLALRLFVVVVAVDPRWLHRCLRQHHTELFQDGEARPPDYLDKIFQVVFALRPMGAAADELINVLMPYVDRPQATGASAPSALEAVRTEEGPAEQGTANPAGKRKSPTFIDLEPGRLRLTKAERDFVHLLRRNLSTPRAVKKLVNLYRLVRIGIPDAKLNAFVAGPYQAVLVMLALLVTDPDAARSTFVKLPETERLSDALPPDWSELANDKFHTDIATYRLWVGTVARFSFETYDLVTESRHASTDTST